MHKALKYRPEIDGLRCFAVLPVICFHLNKDWLPGGYLGVDVFFVISGFLVTLLILEQLALGDFSLSWFWQRRIKRLLPAALAVLLITSAAHDLWFYHPDLRVLSMQKIASLFSFANIYFWRQPGGYMGEAAEKSPFLHFWSLSVEEQYYFFYPALLLILYYKLRRHVLAAIVTITVFSLLVYIYGIIFYPTATFYLLPTRVWQLGAGCLLAYTGYRLPPRWATAGTVLGLAIIAVMYGAAHRIVPGLAAFLVVCGSVLIIAAANNPAAKAVLENKTSLFIGRTSYSLYLWHWPIIVSMKMAGNYGMPRWHVAWSIPFIFLAGTASYFLVETPFRRMKRPTLLILSMVLAAGVFFFLEKRTLLANQYASGILAPSSWHGLYYDLKPRNDLGEGFRAVVATVNTPRREASSSAFKEGGILRIRDTPTPRVVLLGDSHAIMWCKLVDDITAKLNASTSLWTMIAVNPFFDVASTDKVPSKYLSAKEHQAYDQARLEYISRWKPDLIIFAARWENINLATARPLLDFLEQHSKSVVLVESPPPLSGVADRNFAEFSTFLGLRGRDGEPILWPDYDPQRIKATRERVLSFIAPRKTFAFLPIADLYTSTNGVICGVRPTVYYLDDDHLTDAGAFVAHDRFEQTIQRLLTK